MDKKIRIAVFASGGGSNAGEIFRYFEHHATVEVALLLSNNPAAFALERAKRFSISSVVFDRAGFAGGDVLHLLQENKITHLVLAGFLWLLPPQIIAAFPDRIINIHPSLLPKFGGKGMYGMNVHRKVKESKETETGITVHLVNQKYDEGKVLFHASCPISPDDSPEDICAKVNQLEYLHYPRVIDEWVGSAGPIS